MRLVNVHTLTLEDFTGKHIPPYCILSHRWGDEEVSYKEFRKGLKQDSAGYRKIVDFCELVKCRSGAGIIWPLEWHCDWAWIDTCMPS